MDEAAEVDLAVRIRLQVVHTWRGLHFKRYTLGEVYILRGTSWRGTHLERYTFGEAHSAQL